MVKNNFQRKNQERCIKFKNIIYILGIKLGKAIENQKKYLNFDFWFRDKRNENEIPS
jgi:hypothetical protein